MSTFPTLGWPGLLSSAILITDLCKVNLENGKQLGRNIFAGVPWKANVCFDVLLVKKHFFLL